MTTETENSVEMLCEEILAEARRMSEQIIDDSNKEAEKLLAATRSDIERTESEALARAHSNAEHRSELILSTIPVEEARMRSSRIESLLEDIRRKVIQELSFIQNNNYLESIVSLSSAAITRMEGSSFLVRMPERDKNPSGDELEKAIQSRILRSPLKISVSYERDFSGDGPVVQDSEGYQVWDNRLLSRLNRLWPDLRRKIALQAAFV